MRTKENLAKRLLIYVFSLFTLSAVITGCASYDEDLDEVNDKLDNLQAQIDELKNQLETGNYVVSVQTISGGFKITFKDGKTYDVTSGQDGAKGTDGVQWAIGVDSIWYKDGVKTNPPLRAIGQEGKQGVASPSPEIYKKNDNEYHWVVFSWDDTKNEFVPDTLWDTSANSYNTYIVDKDAYSYELNVWNQDEKEYTKLILPKVATDSYILEFLGYEQIKTPSRDISLGDIDTEISFIYWYLTSIYDVASGSDLGTWEGKVNVEKNQVLTTLKRDSIAAIVRTTLTGSAWEMTLKDSDGGAIPIKFEKPVKLKGRLTKAVELDSIYFLQMTGTDETFASETEYLSKFKGANDKGLLFSLVDKGTGAKSEYSASLTPQKLTGGLTQGKVDKVGNKAKNADDDYEISPDTNVSLTFTNSINVYDYYIEAEDADEAEEKFGLEIDKANGTFKVTKAEDEKFNLKIYKLHYNGYVYQETISIKPVVPTP